MSLLWWSSRVGSGAWTAEYLDLHLLLLLGVGHVWWDGSVVAVEGGSGWGRLWSEVLVWVEATEAESSEVREVGDLEQGLLNYGVIPLFMLEVVASLLMVCVLIPIIKGFVMVPWLFYWHCGTNWTIWQGIDELSPVVCAVVEGASFSELALSSGVVVLAWLCLEIRVDSSKSGSAKLFGQGVVWLP